MSSPDIVKVLLYLVQESENTSLERYTAAALESSEVYTQLQLLKYMLTVRSPDPPLPTEINQDINRILFHRSHNKLFTSRHSIKEKLRFADLSPKLSIWKGDITTISDVTAIVNAANSALLGCFQPSHRCIDNIIHAAAGPDLRRACYNLVEQRDFTQEPVGSAQITPGFNLPAKMVIHTVGPLLLPGSEPNQEEISQLAACYTSSLAKLEEQEEDGNDKSIVFCCISTGLFSFPNDIASNIAIESVRNYFSEHPHSSISEVIFNVFTETNLKLYRQNFAEYQEREILVPIEQPIFETHHPIIEVSKKLIQDTDYLIVSAGAGLSASVGLDYSSNEVFDKHYRNFKKYGPTRLYETIGHQWPSKLVEWSFWFHHYETVSRWPASESYQKLVRMLNCATNSFVITSNADGFFIKNGYDPKKVYSIQGNYYWIQCPIKCTQDSFRPMDAELQKVKPYIDLSTNLLMDSSHIPRCENCGHIMTMCLRGGWKFNDTPMETEKKKYKELLNKIVRENQKAVLLEFGVGLNTPSVLRWPNEELASENENNFTLIRVGNGPSSTVPIEYIEKENFIVIDADASEVIDLLVS